MNAQAIVTVIMSTISLCGLCYLVFWGFREYRIDLYRQEMFELRDTLFDEAKGGLIDFNHPAYGLLRSAMNGYIRFGHRLNFLHMLALVVFVRRSDIERLGSFDEMWARAIAPLSEDTVLRLNVYKQKMNMLNFKHVIFGTPEAIMLLPIVIFSILLILCLTLLNIPLPSKRRQHQQRATAWESLKEPFSSIDDAALVYGEQVYL